MVGLAGQLLYPTLGYMCVGLFLQAIPIITPHMTKSIKEITRAITKPYKIEKKSSLLYFVIILLLFCIFVGNSDFLKQYRLLRAG